MKNQLFTLLFFLGCLPLIFAQDDYFSTTTDYVFRRDGKVLRGQILNMTNKEGLTMKTMLGAEVFFPYKEIRKIIRKPAVQNIIDKSYLELGLTYGTPAGLNMVVGYWHGRTGVRLSGMVYSGFTALQLHLGLKLSETTRRRHSIGLSFGNYSFKGQQEGFHYIGPVYNYTGAPFNIKILHNSWFVEIGYVYGFGSGDEIGGGGSFPIVQTGFVHRFVPNAPRNERLPVPKFPAPEPCPTCPDPEPCPACPECPVVAAPIPKKVSEAELGRKVNTPENILVNQSEIVMSIRDNGIPDNDEVSLLFNGEWILEHHILTKKEKEIPIKLLPNAENILVLVAHNMGERSPNTSVITIKDGRRKRTIVLNADLDVSESVQFKVKN
ncbi:MAG: hypothetical protein DHS20C18_24050 [Saprospiraceae bacterium]|nr:MAG: hypothetical protein DHS20C18_24050 [Saprospiraceae bacterium]